MLKGKCRNCIHAVLLNYGQQRDEMCLYIVDEHKPRGCDIGDNCDKFVEGSRKDYLSQKGEMI